MEEIKEFIEVEKELQENPVQQQARNNSSTNTHCYKRFPPSKVKSMGEC